MDYTGGMAGRTGLLLEARINATFSVGALLHRKLVITSLVLEDPVLNLTSDPDGPWNFESPQATVSQKAIPLAVISRVQIKRGQMIASNLLPSDAAGPIFFEAHEIAGDPEQVSLVGIMDPSSSSMDGQGILKAGLLRLGWVEVRREIWNPHCGWNRDTLRMSKRKSMAGMPPVTSPLTCLGKVPALRPMGN